MTANERFENLKAEILGDSPTITSIDEADKLHENLITLRKETFFEGIMDFIPHYRGEQYYGWNIKPGIFRPPLRVPDSQTGKSLEMKACEEFERCVAKNGNHKLKEANYQEKYGKEWDVLLQAQHAGAKTALTDWTALSHQRYILLLSFH